MAKISNLKRILCHIMIFCLLSCYIPNVSFAEAGFWMRNGYTYNMTVKVADEKNAGTNGDIYLKVHFNSGKAVVTHLMDTAKHNDFERNSQKTYSYYIEAQPWEISYVEIKNTSKDGVKIQDFTFGVDKMFSVYRSVNQWIDNSYAMYDVAGDLRRNITDISSTSNFSSAFGSTEYLKSTDDLKDDNVMTAKWYGDIKDQYSAKVDPLYGQDVYKAFGYENSPSMSFTSDGLDKQTLINHCGFKNETDDDGNIVGYSLSRKKLRDKMVENNVYKVNIKTEVCFNKGSDNNQTFTKTYSFVRPEFALEDAKVITSPYTASRDNNYFNSTYNTIEIEVPVKQSKYYNATEIASKASQSYITQAKLYYGKTDSSDYLTPVSKTSKGRMINMKFELPKNFSNKDGIGMTLKMETGYKDSNNNQTYMAPDYEYNFGGKYKVDTSGLSYNLTNVTDFDQYKKTQQFKLDAGEIPYIKGSSSYFSYKLYKTSDKKEELQLTSKYSSTSMVPHTNDTVYDIKLKEKMEGKYLLEINANDVAGNGSTLDKAVKLDNMAPRAAYTSKEVRNGESKYFEANFNIEDISNTGKLYYCFVKDGESVPAVDSSAPETSGSVGTIAGKWAFISQTNPDARSAVFIVNNGEIFKGKLYYYTVDGCGNDSRKESGTGKKDGFYYIDVNVDNSNPLCDITVKDSTPALSEYDISLTSDNSANVITYRWKNNSFTTAEKVYKGEKIGTKVQQDINGKNITLNGKNILEYTVKSSSSQNKVTYTKEFLFDNSKPEVTTSVKNGSTCKTKTININAGDLSKIQTLEYQLVQADKSVIENNELIQIPANSNEISTSVVVAPEKTGAYRVFVRAVDSNGYVTETYSDVFSVRTSAPSIEVSADIEKKTSAGLYLADAQTSQTYRVLLNVSEEFLQAEKSNDIHEIYCRFSDDGINYGDWVEYNTLSAKGDVMSQNSVTAEAPIILNSGENRIFVETVCIARGGSLRNIPEDIIAQSSELVIVYDTEVPQCKVDVNNQRTSEFVKGTLTIKDEYSILDDVTYKAMWTIGSEAETSFVEFDKENAVKNGSEITIPITMFANGGYKIVVTDTCGNKSESTFIVDCIDIQPPTVQYWRHSSIGEVRKDEILEFDVNDASEEKTKFGLYKYEEGDPNVVVVSPDPSASPDPNATYVYMDSYNIPDELFETENSAIQVLSKMDNSMSGANEYGETSLKYNVAMRGSADGRYVPVAYVEDSLGNSQKYVIGPILDLVDAQTEVKEYKVRGVAENEDSPIIAGPKAVVDVTFNVPVYVFPKEKLPDRNDYESDEAYNEEVQSMAVDMADSYIESYSFIISEHGEYTLYFADECNRSYTETITITENDVTFNNYSVSAQLYSTTEGNEDMDSWTPIDSIPVFESGKDYYLILDGSGNSQYFTEGSSDDGIVFESDKSEQSGEYVDGETTYTKTVYHIYNWGSNNLKLSYRMQTDDTDIGAFVVTNEVYELNILDTTEPEILVEYSTEMDTKDPVNVMLSFYDFDVGETVDSEGEYTEEELARKVGIKEVRITDITAGDYDWDTDLETLDYKKIKKKVLTDESTGATEDKEVNACTNHTVTFTENGWFAVKVTNNLGLTYTEVIEIYNIIDDPITEDDDFYVGYFYKDADGDKQEIVPDGVYRSVIAEIIPTEIDPWRKLYIANNGGSFERELTNFDNSFTFIIKDRYGYTYEKTVSYDSFDENGPDISYEYSKEKTNKSVDVTITVSDASGVDSVVLKDNSGAEIPLVSSGDEYTGEVSENGRYVVTAADLCGNISNKSFTVNNINKAKPEVYDLVYTTKEMTNRIVGVKLYYTKSNVEITKVEPAEGTNSGDVMVDYSSSTLRFKENGTVTVTFADEYGNEGQKVVTVTNINREAPSLKAVCTPSSDNKSVKVTFALDTNEPGQQTDATGRKLSDITILYYGKSATADEAEFEFVENGKYKFQAYDSIGNTQVIQVNISDIDTTVPKITQVSWSYKYTDAQTGNLVDESGVWQVGDEAGYSIAEDSYKATNQNVTVTATTDKETVFTGSQSSDYSTTHEIEYDENGWFNFNLEGKNKLMSQYGVGIYLIDKIPPVIENVDNLIFYENKNAGTEYSKDLLTNFKAYDVKGKTEIDLTSQVTVDYGRFNPDNFEANKFDRANPYEITYTVKDKVGNVTQVKRTVTLVGVFDTLMLVNGSFPDSSNRIEVESDKVELSLHNFSGKAYARYEKGYYTIGEMKDKGTVIQQDGDKFVVSGLASGWYTFYVQTDLRDYFCVNVYVI